MKKAYDSVSTALEAAVTGIEKEIPVREITIDVGAVNLQAGETLVRKFGNDSQILIFSIFR